MNKFNRTILACMMTNIIMLPAIASPATPSPIALNGEQLQNMVYEQDKSDYLTQKDIMTKRRSDTYGFLNLLEVAGKYRSLVKDYGNDTMYGFWNWIITDLEALDQRYESAIPPNFDYRNFKIQYGLISIFLPFATYSMNGYGYIDDAEALEFTKYIMMPAQLMLDNKSSFKLWDGYTWEALEEAVSKWQAMVDSGIYDSNKIRDYLSIGQEWVTSADAVY